VIAKRKALMMRRRRRNLNIQKTVLSGKEA
jgi:hypothetical protein